LNIIQFGFNEESRSKLHITVYLRALEVNHFLKINLSEIYHLLNIIVNSFRAITDLDLSIFAFRAQFKGKFGCFKKAEIDYITPTRLARYVLKREIPQIIKLLTEKMDISETVVHAEGIKNIANAVQEAVDDEGYDFYTHSIVETCKSLISLYDKLIAERKRTSLHHEIEKIEKEIYDHIKELIESLKNLSGDNK
jgi:nitrogen regulatory protein PII-like uncharacterized protein